jgi:hypothetical protein
VITLHFTGAASIEVSQAEIVALEAFGLVIWDDFRARGEFRTGIDVTAAQVQRFLKAFRA